MAMERLTRRIVILVVLVVVLAACNGSSGEPTATYNGSGCTYDGPGEFDNALERLREWQQTLPASVGGLTGDS